ncbi:MAG: short-chain dehydrogenase [Acidobacteria bacterium]|nr:MAG: short-chain dehydrogenase [Acidobacteriota bacterium]
MSFQGKNALVTGSSRGIGRGIALKLAEKGARVAVHYYRNRDAAEATLAKIRQLGSSGFLVQADVCRPDEVRRIFEQVRAEFGSLDIFVSNARTEAPTFYQAPMDITLSQWDTAVDSQAKAFLVAVREAAPLMPNGGRIVAITFAPGGRFGSWQPWVAMGAAKAAMESLVRYFAVALAERDITVNSISPGWVEDSVLNSLPEVFQSGLRDWQERGWTPMRRLGRPSDIGNAVALICSQEAGWITGQLIEVDGGASLVDAHLPLEFQGIARQAKVQGT